MTFVTLLGYFAATLTSLSFVPQAWMIIKTRKTGGISLVMYSAFTIGVACWLIYGLMLQAKPLIIANIVTFTLAATILSLTAYERKNSKKLA